MLGKLKDVLFSLVKIAKNHLVDFISRAAELAVDGSFNDKAKILIKILLWLLSYSLLLLLQKIYADLLYQLLENIIRILL